MTRLSEFLLAALQKLRTRLRRRKLRGPVPSLICINCIGGVVYHDLGLPFASPTINLWFPADDFLRFAVHLREFLQEGEWTELADPAYPYPSGLLRCGAGEARVYFQHYRSFGEARAAWERRAARVDYDNLVLLIDAYDADRARLEEYQALPYGRKAILCDSDQCGLPNVFRLHAYDRPGRAPDLPLRRKPHSLHKWYEEFDIIAFLNEGKLQPSRWGRRMR